MTKPLAYLDFLVLEKCAKKILTDSGGIQKEAYMLGVTCITLRENTEWVETVEDGWNILVGTDTEKTIEAVRNFKPGHRYSEVYGQGACEKISNIMKGY